MKRRAWCLGSVAISVACALELTACGGGHPGRADVRTAVPLSLVTPTTERVAEARQRCVDRWNQMNPSQLRTLAVVSVRSARCEIDLAESFQPDRRTCALSRPLPGTPRMCVDRTTVFSCFLNRAGAYECPEHGYHSQRELAGWNATIGNDRALELDHPPQAWSKTPLPRWAAKYPHEDGFVLPWRSGQLRAGLTLSRRVYGTCYAGGSESTRTQGALRCFAGDLVYDPCFAGAKPRRLNVTIAACPYGPGSLRFLRLLIRGKR